MIDTQDAERFRPVLDEILGHEKLAPDTPYRIDSIDGDVANVMIQWPLKATDGSTVPTFLPFRVEIIGDGCLRWQYTP